VNGGQWRFQSLIICFSEIVEDWYWHKQLVLGGGVKDTVDSYLDGDMKVLVKGRKGKGGGRESIPR